MGGRELDAGGEHAVGDGDAASLQHGHCSIERHNALPDLALTLSSEPLHLFVDTNHRKERFNEYNST